MLNNLFSNPGAALYCSVFASVEPQAGRDYEIRFYQGDGINSCSAIVSEIKQVNGVASRERIASLDNKSPSDTCMAVFKQTRWF